MKKKRVIFCIILLVTLGKSAHVFSQNKNYRSKFRTDGFYFYDNGIDTFRTVRNSGDLWLLNETQLKKHGLTRDPKRIKCTPDGVAILKKSSTLLHYICFFNDSTGTAFEDVCNCREGVDQSVQLIRTRMAKNDDANADIQRIHSIYFLDDSTFTFDVSKENYFKENFTVTMRNDSLIASQRRVQFGQTAQRKYVFIPFDSIPEKMKKIEKRCK